MNKKKMGRPRIDNPLSERFPSIRLSKDQLARYQAAAERAGISFAEWVRNVLDRAS